MLVYDDICMSYILFHNSYFICLQLLQYEKEHFKFPSVYHIFLMGTNDMKQSYVHQENLSIS